MAQLVDVYNIEKENVLKRRQLPLHIYENLTMVMDLNPMGLVCDNPQLKGRAFEDFMRKYKTLNSEEIKEALIVDATDVFNVLNQTIPCVGCRRSVERLFSQLCKSGHPALDPLVFTQHGSLTIREDKTNPYSLAPLLNGHSNGIDCVVLGSHRWKKSQRCAIHSLEAGCVGVVRGWCGSWGGRAAWRTAWDCMRGPARAHVTLVQYSVLHDTLHAYLRKHRFCSDCKTKVLRAYVLLVEEKEPEKEKGYVAALYSGIKCCLMDKHLHLQPKTEYIGQLIARAEPELLGNHRERHAKTMEIAQEEVLICLGICIYERLQRITLRLREEENMCQMLAAVGVEALYRKFETTLELRRGVSKLELLYDEITQEELTRQQRKEQKKLKKRRKKERQAIENKCKVLSALSFYASGSYQRCIGASAHHKMHQVSMSNCLRTVTLALNNDHFRKKYITFPQTNQERNIIKQGFYQKFGMPGVVGCVDGTQIAIVRPTDYEERFFNRKRYHSLNTQIEVDSEEAEKCNCEECMLEEVEGRDTPTELTPRECCSTGDCHETKPTQKSNKNGKLSPNDHSQDCGYSSGHNHGCCDTMSGCSSLGSSPEGSEVACSEGFCNHDRGDCLDLTKGSKTSCGGFLYSLEEMLMETSSSDEDPDTSYIPMEDVLEFKARRNVTEKRQELRNNLRQKFAQLCVNVPPNMASPKPVNPQSA